jgi:hypothetical protein
MHRTIPHHTATRTHTHTHRPSFPPARFAGPDTLLRHLTPDSRSSLARFRRVSRHEKYTQKKLLPNPPKSLCTRAMSCFCLLIITTIIVYCGPATCLHSTSTVCLGRRACPSVHLLSSPGLSHAQPCCLAYTHHRFMHCRCRCYGPPSSPCTQCLFSASGLYYRSNPFRVADL